MKITVKNADLSKELNLLEKVTGDKPTIAVLANVLIQAQGTGLVLSATDLQIGLVGACAAEVEEPGAVTLPAKKLMEIVRAQSGTDLTMTSDPKGSVNFSSGKFKSKLQSLPAHDFPGIPPVSGHPAISLPRAPLKDMISQVRYAVSEKEQRYFMKGVLMLLNEGELSLVATDTARLSFTSTKREGAAQEPVLIPNAAVDELFALLAEAPLTPDVTFARSERHLFFDLDGRLLISRMIDGQFPPFERIIPKQNNLTAEIERYTFTSVLRRAILIDSVITMRLRKDSLEVAAASVLIGSGSEDVPVVYEGPDLDMKFKGEYIIDFLNAASSQNITLALRDRETPALFRDGDYFNVIMGMRA